MIIIMMIMTMVDNHSNYIAIFLVVILLHPSCIITSHLPKNNNKPTNKQT